MSRKKSPKPKPPPSPTISTASKKAAAIGQLESAIILWFNGADPISILVLASNAEDCFHAIGKKIGKPSFWQEFLERQPDSFKERAKYIQDFAKHGFKDLEEDTDFETRYGEMLILAAIDACHNIYGPPTPTSLMRLFHARYYSEFPDMALKHYQSAFLDFRSVGFAEGTRKEFFNEFARLL